MSDYVECPCKVVTIVGPLAERHGDGYLVLTHELAVCAGCGANWIHLSDGGGRWVKNDQPEFNAVLKGEPIEKGGA